MCTARAHLASTLQLKRLRHRHGLREGLAESRPPPFGALLVAAYRCPRYGDTQLDRDLVPHLRLAIRQPHPRRRRADLRTPRSLARVHRVPANVSGQISARL